MRQNFTSGYPYEDVYGYSRAVRVGDMIFVSGTTARSPHLGGSAYDQSRAALETIGTILAQAGADLRHVVRTVLYVRNMDDAPLIARAHSEAFGSIRPASTLVEVSRLTPIEALVEIEVSAIVSD